MVLTSHSLHKYIAIHRFFVSQFFNMARFVRCFKLRIETWQTLCQSDISSQTIIILSVSERIFFLTYVFLRIHYQSPGGLNSWEELLHFRVTLKATLTQSRWKTKTESTTKHNILSFKSVSWRKKKKKKKKKKKIFFFNAHLYRSITSN